MSDDSNNLTPAEKYKKLFLEEKARSEAEKQALIQEFMVSIPKEWTPEDLKDKVRDLLAKAYARISATIDLEDQPALAYKAAKDVFDIGIGRIQITDENDPNKEFTDLLKAMKPKTEKEKILEKLVAEEQVTKKKDDDTSTSSS